MGKRRSSKSLGRCESWTQARRQQMSASGFGIAQPAFYR